MLLTICWLEIEPKVEANEKNTKPQSINVPLFKNQNFQESCLSCVGSYHIDFKINKVLSEVKRIIKNSINKKYLYILKEKNSYMYQICLLTPFWKSLNLPQKEFMASITFHLLFSL